MTGRRSFMLIRPITWTVSRSAAHTRGMRVPLSHADPLGEALHFLRMTGVIYCRSEFTAPWAISLPPLEDCLMFHVVTSGRCVLEVTGADDLILRPGDFALVPKVIGVDAWNSPEAEWMQSTLRLMAVEAREQRPGGETVITRLADILVIQAIRSWIAKDPAARTGWLGALQDKQIGHALALVHREPARPWTVESLANEVAMSRSAFAARFTALVGEPAMHYVARWRMHVALTWLKEEGAPVSEMAVRLGYESEAAFSRAFKRFLGFPPGAVRRAKSDQSAPASIPLGNAMITGASPRR